ncbi:MAG: hypothetical protein LBI56_00380 [Puniceicoccales bacterium]|nr:hypothetical protein [Puniceicoccales bacterium]
MPSAGEWNKFFRRKIPAEKIFLFFENFETAGKLYVDNDNDKNLMGEYFVKYAPIV